MYPERQAARQITHYAVSVGKLKKQPCEVCGDVNVQAHHEDYTKPMEVRWLCRRHHNDAHGKGTLTKPRKLLLKLKPELHAVWKASADAVGLTLSEWIRRACNAGLSRSESEKQNGNETNQDLSRAKNGSAPRRRRATAGREPTRGSRPEHREPDSAPTTNELVGAVAIPQSEVLPAAVAPVVHTATSNRLTCLCNTCTSYRKTNGLPCRYV